MPDGSKNKPVDENKVNTPNQEPKLKGENDTITKENAVNNEAGTMLEIYNQLNNLFGGSQLFVMEYPTRGLNQLDYAYKIEDYNSSSILKPYVIAENEFRLTDSLMDLAPIVQGTNGKKLSTEYQTVINNYAPQLKDITGFITDKMELRLFLLEKITDKIGDQEYTCSRMEFCQKLYLHYLKQKADWDQEKFEKNQKAVEENTLNEYAAWLSTTAWTKDKQLEALFNDAIVRGFYHEIMTILGFIDVASPAERLENVKTNLRTSVRRRLDGSGDVYPVSLSPSDWFRALTPNYSPQDLLADANFLTMQYQQKKQILASLQSELRLLMSQQIDPKQIQALENSIANKRKALSDKEKEFAGLYGESTVKIVKLALEMAAKGNMVGFLSSASANGTKEPILKTVCQMLNIQDGTNISKDANKPGTLSNLVTDMIEMNKNHIDYFADYEELMAMKLTEAKYQTTNRQEAISILQERIEILSDEVSRIEVILASGVNKGDTSTITANGMFPTNRYDGDGMFSEVVISHEYKKDESSSTDKIATGGLSGSVHRFLWSASANANYSSSTHEFSKMFATSNLKIGMRVMKVSIERGGWFDPGIIDISSSFMHIKDFKASNGKQVEDFLGDRDGNTLNDNSVLPGFPSAFLIAKDIHIVVENIKIDDQQFESFQKSACNASTSLFGFRLSGSVAMEKSKTKASSDSETSTLSIKIPGPQIIGWFMQLTPDDKSEGYTPFSGSETFTEIIDSLKDYKQKMKELRENNTDDYVTITKIKR